MSQESRNDVSSLAIAGSPAIAGLPAVVVRIGGGHEIYANPRVVVAAAFELWQNILRRVSFNSGEHAVPLSRAAE